MNNFVRIQLSIDTSNAPINAAVNVVTENPRIIVPKYQNSIPFTTRENRPRVIIFIGRVSIFIIGRKNMLKSVRQAPTISATQIGLTVTPEIIWVVAQTATESIIQCKIILIRDLIKKIMNQRLL